MLIVVKVEDSENYPTILCTLYIYLPFVGDTVISLTRKSIFVSNNNYDFLCAPLLVKEPG